MLFPILFCIKKHKSHSQAFLWVGQLAFQHPVLKLNCPTAIFIYSRFDLMLSFPIPIWSAIFCLTLLTELLHMGQKLGEKLKSRSLTKLGSFYPFMGRINWVKYFYPGGSPSGRASPAHFCIY